MRTKELLLKNDLTREEKIAHLKKLGLWREFQKEIKKRYADILYPTALQHALIRRCTWRDFLLDSLIFRRTSRGREFWLYIADNGKKPLK